MQNDILLASYWEHFKAAKDLARYLPIDHPKRLALEKEVTIMLEKINKGK
jgi:hypothetical protein